MLSVSTSLPRVSSSATWSSRTTDFHRRGTQPDHVTRTPISCISSRLRRITSRLKPIRNRTSSGERVQFSVENAYAEIAPTPISMAPSTTSNSAASPISWPLVRGSPRALAQRPLPSIVIATWRGTSAFGISGGRAPEGCGFGALTERLTSPTLGSLDVLQGAQAALEVPVQERRDHARRLAQVAGVGDRDRVPGAREQRTHHVERLRGGRRGAGHPAVGTQGAPGRR